MAVANWASGVGGARTIDPASRETRGDGEAAPGAMREDPAVVWAAASPLAASAGWSAVSQGENVEIAYLADSDTDCGPDTIRRNSSISRPASAPPDLLRPVSSVRPSAAESMRMAKELLELNHDPGVWLYKDAEMIGRQHRRWFVLHRGAREFAYYDMAFIPPRTARKKGAIDLNNITGVSSSGDCLEISVAKGRRAYRLYAESPREASAWATALRLVTSRERMLYPSSPVRQPTLRSPDHVLVVDAESSGGHTK